ncbi:aldo/keto reductase [Acuticoccus kandeliae]|uniref:aldo/keto reductase n=1 Tax=Acuticoccus kandeliae TaxID=2073160 RepID=UPI000D3EAAE9|nr:aldo/keto reductase [Acuticoccus kandeliae]
MAANTNAERVDLAPDLSVSRITKGNWQLAQRHGPEVEREVAIEDMRRFVEAGFTNFDCADHYVQVEELIGEFRTRYPDLAKQLTVQTKVVPDRDVLPRIKKADIEFVVDRAIKRLGVEVLDLAQFHWWDYDVPGYVEAMGWMQDLKKEGKLRYVGTTNFDCQRMSEIIESGVEITSHQLQYSVIDRRPEHGMVALAEKHGFGLQCYGVVAGGFLSPKYLGAADPAAPLANRSLVKYRLILDEFGPWSLFQEMLTVLAAVGEKHGTNLSNVAIRYVLDKPQVATAIVGAKTAEHLEALKAVASLKLDADDRAAIEAVIAKGAGPEGDCYALERVPGGRHTTIMWTNQNLKGVGAR